MANKELDIDPHAYSFYDVIDASPSDQIDDLETTAELAYKQSHPDYGADLTHQERKRVENAREIFTDEELRSAYNTEPIALGMEMETTSGDQINERNLFVNEEIRIIPTNEIGEDIDGFTKDYDIIIQDGNSEEIITPNEDGEVIHSFGSEGQKEITIQRKDELIEKHGNALPFRFRPYQTTITVESADERQLEITKHWDGALAVNEKGGIKVTYADTGELVSGATVYINDVEVGETQLGGTFTYEPNTPNTRTLEVSKEEQTGVISRGEITVDVERQQKELFIEFNDTDFYTGEKATISIVDGDSDPVPNARITVNMDGDRVEYQTKSNGKTKIELKTAGKVKLRAHKDTTPEAKYTTTRREITVEDPPQIELTAQTEPKSRLSGDHITITATFPDISKNFTATGYDDVASITVYDIAADGRRMGVIHTEDVDIAQTISTTTTPYHEGDYEVEINADGYRQETETVTIENPADTGDTNKQNSANGSTTGRETTSNDSTTSNGNSLSLPSLSSINSLIPQFIYNTAKTPLVRSDFVTFFLMSAFTIGTVWFYLLLETFDPAIRPFVILAGGIVYVVMMIFPRISFWGYLFGGGAVALEVGGLAWGLLLPMIGSLHVYTWREKFPSLE